MANKELTSRKFQIRYVSLGPGLLTKTQTFSKIRFDISADEFFEFSAATIKLLDAQPLSFLITEVSEVR